MSDDSRKKPMAAIAPFGLRMQPELKERIERAAEAAGRSMNSEVTYRLEAFEALHDELSALKQKDIENEMIISRLTGQFMEANKNRPPELPDSYIRDFEKLERGRYQNIKSLDAIKQLAMELAARIAALEEAQWTGEKDDPDSQ